LILDCRFAIERSHAREPDRVVEASAGSIFLGDRSGAYVGAITATCILQAAIVFRANQSVITAMLFHGSLNASEVIINLPDASNRYIPWIWGLGAIIGLILMLKLLFRWPRRVASSA
jgi:hypothetical protein